MAAKEERWTWEKIDRLSLPHDRGTYSKNKGKKRGKYESYSFTNFTFLAQELGQKMEQGGRNLFFFDFPQVLAVQVGDLWAQGVIPPPSGKEEWERWGEKTIFLPGAESLLDLAPGKESPSNYMIVVASLGEAAARKAAAFLRFKEIYHVPVYNRFLSDGREIPLWTYLQEFLKVNPELMETFVCLRVVKSFSPGEEETFHKEMSSYFQKNKFNKKIVTYNSESVDFGDLFQIGAEKQENKKEYEKERGKWIQERVDLKTLLSIYESVNFFSLEELQDKYKEKASAMNYSIMMKISEMKSRSIEEFYVNYSYLTYKKYLSNFENYERDVERVFSPLLDYQEKIGENLKSINEIKEKNLFDENIFFIKNGIEKEEFTMEFWKLIYEKTRVLFYYLSYFLSLLSKSILDILLENKGNDLLMTTLQPLCMGDKELIADLINKNSIHYKSFTGTNYEDYLNSLLYNKIKTFYIHTLFLSKKKIPSSVIKSFLEETSYLQYYQSMNISKVEDSLLKETTYYILLLSSIEAEIERTDSSLKEDMKRLGKKYMNYINPKLAEITNSPDEKYSMEVKLYKYLLEERNLEVVKDWKDAINKQGDVVKYEYVRKVDSLLEEVLQKTTNLPEDEVENYLRITLIYHTINRLKQILYLNIYPLMEIKQEDLEEIVPVSNTLISILHTQFGINTVEKVEEITKTISSLIMDILLFRMKVLKDFCLPESKGSIDSLQSCLETSLELENYFDQIFEYLPVEKDGNIFVFLSIQVYIFSIYVILVNEKRKILSKDVETVKKEKKLKILVLSEEEKISEEKIESAAFQSRAVYEKALVTYEELDSSKTKKYQPIVWKEVEETFKQARKAYKENNIFLDSKNKGTSLGI